MTSPDIFGSVLGSLFAIAVLWIAVWLCILLPLRMARDRNRQGWVWVLISLCGSPILAILLLIALGPSQQ